MSDVIEYAKNLISRASVTPEDQGCQDFMISTLAKIGFEATRLPFGDVHNFWARHGSSHPLVVFAGHTDVVPTGPLDAWDHPPFEPTSKNGFLYGRGAADMKGSLAAMLVACEHFVAKTPDHPGSIAFLITSDEEGPAIDGTIKVMDYLQAQNEKIDFCIVGEPSSTQDVGDVIKTGRRGSLSGNLIIKGVQGHVAYPQLADNPIHRFAPVLKALTEMTWDDGNEFFPPTTFQVSNINAGTGVGNVIPGELNVQFNFRYSTELTHQVIQTNVLKLLDSHQLDYALEWNHSGKPFLTVGGQLIEATCEAVRSVTQRTPQLSTAGGTSDGRFIAPSGAEVVELGPINKTIHKLNECVKETDLVSLVAIYEKMLSILLK